MAEKPLGIEVEVPEEYGSVYTNPDKSRQFVSRRQQMGKKLIKTFEGLTGIYTDEKAYKEGCKILGRVFVDWNLADSETGPLPKPWGNPAAFEALFDMDLDLSLWVLGLIHQPISELLSPEKN